MPRVLYVVYWGLLEPLGAALVVPAILRLAGSGVRLTVISYEKPVDFERLEAREHMRSRLEAAGIGWHPLRYHRRPKVPATFYDWLCGLVVGLRLGVRGAFEVVHARTYVGGLIGWPLAALLRARLIYHNEGFYPDEQVDGGVWRAGSAVHRFARFLERLMYRAADGIVVLSQRAGDTVRQLPPVRSQQTPVLVVPSCVDLDLFQPRTDRRPPVDQELRLVYIGTIGWRYLFGDVARFAALAKRAVGRMRLRVLTRTDRAQVTELLVEAGFPLDACTIDEVAHTDMPAELAAQHAGLFFLRQGTSEHGCSPTKIGEYWAMGLPVVSTSNVSDTDHIIRSENVGVIVHEHTEAEYERAVEELLELLADPGLPGRCRAAAERHYALSSACDKQAALYRDLMAT